MRGLVVAVWLCGCVQSSSVVCGDGSLCPPGTRCKTIALDTGSGSIAACAEPDQLLQCANKANGDACTVHASAGGCHDGVCLPAVCGNSLVDPGEACDDGNLITEDGSAPVRCSSDCRSN